MQELPFRQIHLDFHTSGAIAEVGADFDPEQFADTLARAHVNSVNCFARCWHGWMYYDSKRFPDDVHPGLVNRNILAEQIEACHARGIAAPIYVAAQVASVTAERHPEWMQMTPEGRLGGRGPFEPGFKAPLCLNTPYADYLKEHIIELFDVLPAVDGFWFDAVGPQNCCCRVCRAEMERRGLDPSDKSARRLFGLEVNDTFQREMSALVRERNPEALLFYNAGHIGPRHRPAADDFTHFEIESLPSGGWGYLHFPSVARYVRTFGKQIVGMTGKFHTSWGDFHSFKNRAALEFECFHMLAVGAKCSIGDQLHPRGHICPHTYELIGSVYAQIEQKEPWCARAVPLSEIAVLTPEELLPETFEDNLPPPVMGAVRMLQELGMQFDIIDGVDGVKGYKVLIIPDGRRIDAELAAQVDEFVQTGGAVICTGTGGLTPEGTDFALECLGIDYQGPADYSPEFIVPASVLADGLNETEYVMYLAGTKVQAREGTEVVCQAMRPYFNRTWRHFCSHRHAPSAGEAVYPAVTRRGNCIYFSHPLFSQYHDNAALWCKKLVKNALMEVLPQPLLAHDGPSSLLATVTEQADERRYVVHLLHYIPERRGTAFDVIEDAIPLHNVTVRLKLDRDIANVALVPRQETLEFTQANGIVTVRAEGVDGHQMLELRY
jgi:hypothetical protein